jgi:hypothetical protein
MNVAIAVAASDDYQPLIDVTNPSKVRYAQKHGYKFYHFVVPKEMGDACKKEAYDRLWAAGWGDDPLSLFVWIDGDALIMNSDITIETIVNEHLGDGHFLWSYDHAGPNSGVYIARFSSQARHWLDRAYATMLENGLADETAMEILMVSKPFSDWVRVCPGWVMNAYDARMYGLDKYTHRINQFGPDSFIAHFPGIPNDTRIPILKDWAARAK